MGLYDVDDNDDGFFFADFAAGSPKPPPPASPPVSPKHISHDDSSTDESGDSGSSAASSLVNAAHKMKPLLALKKRSHKHKRPPRLHIASYPPNPTTTEPKSAARPSRSARLPSASNSNFKPGHRRRLSSFDLWGEDDELQTAEASIGFCDICLKHCEIHR